MDTAWQPISLLIAEDQRKKTFTALKTFSKAVTDFLQDEIMLLNDGIQKSTIFSSMKEIISEEVVEFREDAGDEFRMNLLGQNRDYNGEDTLLEKKHNRTIREYGNSTIVESMVGKADGCDDECSDFLTRQNDRIYQDVPNLITFKSKKRKNNPNSEETQPEDRQIRMESSNSAFCTTTISAYRRIEPVARIKNYLKFPSWQKRKKRRAFAFEKH